jgi:hypothetical protein
MRDMKLFIGMPLYGSMPWQTVVALNTLLREGLPGIEIRFKLLQGESNIVEARNCLTAVFLESDCDKLLLLDSDMVFRPGQVGRLAAHLEHVVGALYCKKKSGHPDYCCAGAPGQEKSVADHRGLIEVERIGTGMLCIHRHVFELMKRDLPLTTYWTHRGQQFDFWHIEYQPGADGRLWYQGEDYAWCARWRKRGGKIFADAQVLAGHVGSMIFPNGWELSTIN